MQAAQHTDRWHQLHQAQGPVPVWRPDPADPAGVDGTWMLVDPCSPRLHPNLAAQARAVARLWATRPRAIA